MHVTKLLESLNLFGLGHLDAVILAALTDEQPLLLIGEHGTAKSELLNRIALSLDLEHRHYNASLLAFDDLLGFPVPNKERTRIEYIQTADSLWDAESVFLDELSRCRVENQNKLFSIVHERKVQGRVLESLRYRWAAINPPPSLDGDDEDSVVYAGSLPLDPALADRFPYVIKVPALDDFDHATRKRIFAGAQQPETKNNLVPGLLKRSRHLRAKISKNEYEWIRAYVNELVLPLKGAGLGISARRGVQLTKTLASVFAASKALGHTSTLSECALTALVNGIPHRAHGIRVRYAKLKALHDSALKAVGDDDATSVWRTIRSEKDPVKRIAIALTTTPELISKIDFSTLVTDAWSGIKPEYRYLLSGILLSRLSTSNRVTSATYETIAEPTKKLAKFASKDNHNCEFHRNKAREWDKINASISALKMSKHPHAKHLGNIFYTLFVVDEQHFDPDKLIVSHGDWNDLFAVPKSTRKTRGRKAA